MTFAQPPFQVFQAPRPLQGRPPADTQLHTYSVLSACIWLYGAGMPAFSRKFIAVRKIVKDDALWNPIRFGDCIILSYFVVGLYVFTSLALAQLTGREQRTAGIIPNWHTNNLQWFPLLLRTNLWLHLMYCIQESTIFFLLTLKCKNGRCRAEYKTAQYAIYDLPNKRRPNCKNNAYL